MNTQTTITQNSSSIQYGGLLIACSASGFLAGTLLWLADNPTIQHPELWRIGGISAGVIASILALKAMKAGQLFPAQPSQTRASSQEEGRTKLSEVNLSSQSTEAENTRFTNSLERERERLRHTGFSEAEISQILIAREVSGESAKSAIGSGVATGVLNNLDAVVAHARNLMPGFKSDLGLLFDATADKVARISGAISLALKILALIIIGYFVYIEALQLRSQAYKAWAEACIERQKNAINFTPMNKLLSGYATKDLDAECAP